MVSKYSDLKLEQNVFYLGSQITVIMIFIIPVWINIYCKVLFVYCFHHWSMIIYFISVYFQIIYFVDFILYCLFTSCSLANKFFFLIFYSVLQMHMLFMENIHVFHFSGPLHQFWFKVCYISFSKLHLVPINRHYYI